ncbi:pyridoxamine 5'-phosphate oxidase [Mycobacterium sp. 852002-53434_SCH5985345]|uniref:pyridoxamine 5'-phosphate oxidase family protein n=1 Tax=Mycobacterium sp. 852002-53434_SCH5985345 TaxID=1834107 RepID=UPI0007FDEE85|nr:pyridoxamine 5'-phosphate oxidase family protein [Mycobacterium sp. 852002-53434_SCH5985345]OBF58939.1 pyridoxamine 5'-phosphate oxidase [Mycobacterium sp. 852002-53434_SCH5985345]
MTATGFHEGETATQRRAGVEAEAGRLEAMLDSSGLSPGAAKFLASQRFAAMTARDHAGVLWISPLAAPPGFLRGHHDILRVSAFPRGGDPLQAIPTGQQVGLIAIDFATRRRLRVNGELISAEDPGGMTIRVDQSYGNCPKYIHRHTIDVATLATHPRIPARRAAVLDASDQALIARADTFFLGTSHATRGRDASHRGGPPGFVRVDSPSRLWWPDFPGNNMFNSFGNLAVDDEAALLFLDFTTGATLHITGTAHVVWTKPGEAGDDGGVGRNVAFAVNAVAR